MNKDKLRLALIIIIIVGLLSSIYIGIQRHTVEKGNKNVDLTIDYEDFKETVGAWNMEEALSLLKNSGITSVAIPEKNLKSLMREGRIIVLSGGELLQREKPGMDKKDINPNYTYIFVKKQEDFVDLSYELTSRFTGERVEVKEIGNDKLITLKYMLSQGLWDMEMGLDMSIFDYIKEMGLNIIPRIKNNHHFDEKYIVDLFGKLEDYPISSIIFVGNEVLGYPENIDIAGESLNHYNIPFGIIETVVGPSSNLKQAGMDKLAKEVNYNTTRVFSLSENEMKILPTGEILDKWSRCFERNNRIVYIRMKSRNNGAYPEENIAVYSNLIKKLSARMIRMGYSPGKVNPTKPIHASKLALILVSAGATAGGLLLLNKFTPLKENSQIIIFVVLLLPIIALLFTRFWVLDVSAIALASSIIFPSLSIIALIDHIEFYRNENSMLLFLKTICITIIGALFTAGVLTNTRFLLKLDSYRGVKLAFVLPLILVSIYYIGRYGSDKRIKHKSNLKGFIKNISKIIEYHVKVKHLILLGIIGAVAGIYILRSGNLPSIGISGLEVRLRTFLERIFVARPRTKEFLIGHPLLILLLGIKAKPGLEKLMPLLALGVTIGQISIVNTFSHLHIPIMTSISRTIYGIIVGFIPGIILLVFVRGVAALIYNNKGKEFWND